MRQPEAEENGVVPTFWLPVEDVCVDVGHPAVAHLPAVAFQHPWRPVDGGDRARMADELSGERSVPACELEHVSGGCELVDEGAGQVDRHLAADPSVGHGFVAEVGCPEVVELALRRNETGHPVGVVGPFAHRKRPDSQP